MVAPRVYRKRKPKAETLARANKGIARRRENDINVLKLQEISALLDQRLLHPAPEEIELMLDEIERIVKGVP